MARILVADDDALIRGYLREALTLDDHDVITASDGAEAIQHLLHDRTIDTVLTDYAMPRANGLEVIAKAKEIDATLPCVIVTAFRDLDLAMKAMQAGAVGFIPKPFKTEYLLTAVNRALERRALETEAYRLRVVAPILERFTMILASTLETKDFSTQRHSERLVYFADLVAEQMGLSQDVRAQLRLGACLHDIGKVAIPETILNKPTALTPGEFDEIKRHPEVGAAILRSVETWQDVQLIVRHHHERFDGKGYPSGLRGYDIPLGARIVGVVDAFDVMHAGRAYSKARTVDESLSELRRESGKQFDPDVVIAFLACAERVSLDGYAEGQHRDQHPVGGWLIPEQEVSLTKD